MGQQSATRRPQLPRWLTIRVMDEGDRANVATMFSEPLEAISDTYMVSLVAESEGGILAVLRGWLGHPHGHIEAFHVDMTATPRHRFQAGIWLLRTFEALLDTVGALGWTAMTNEQNGEMRRILESRQAKVLPGNHHIFVRRWR